MVHKSLLSKILLLCALLAVVAASPASAAQKFVEFTVPACQ
jgi:hypothetical protein